jgi:hypothetical protein
LDYTEQLRLLALNDTAYVERLTVGDDVTVADLDTKVLALTRLSALIATGGALPSYCAETDAAIDAGAKPDEVVAVLIGVASVVAVPCIVAAAPSLALALGYDTEVALEGLDDPSSSPSTAE